MTADARLLELYTGRSAHGAGQGVERFLPPDRTTFFAYGRQALAEGLRRLGIRAGDTVLLPGLICREVLASLAAVGASPRFYTVDEELRVDEAALERAASDARAVLVVNYFGFPQPLPPFTGWCRRHSAVLIEDNAHGFLSAENGIPLGHRGDIGVFSLRKTLALPNGAALVQKRRGPSALDGFRFTGSVRAAERRYRVKMALRRVIGLAGLRGARALIECIRLTRLVAIGSRVPVPAPDAETALPREEFAPLAARLLLRCDVAAESDRRRRLYERCRELFEGVHEVRPLFAELPAGVVPYGFPFLYGGDDPSSLITSWWQRGVPIQPWPDLPVAVGSTAPGHYRRVMFVPFLW